MVTFYIAGGVAVVAAAMAVSRREPMHALLYLMVMLLASAVILLLLGAQFAAALEVILYAGAIMVLFVFVLMTLGRAASPSAIRGRDWIGPGVLASALLAEWVFLIGSSTAQPMEVADVSPQAVGSSLFGPYLLGVELASMLLLAGLVAAVRLARPADATTSRRSQAARTPLPRKEGTP